MVLVTGCLQIIGKIVVSLVKNVITKNLIDPLQSVWHNAKSLKRFQMDQTGC